MRNEPNMPRAASPRELVVVARPEAEMCAAGRTVNAHPDYDVSALGGLLRAGDVSIWPLFGMSEARLKLRARDIQEMTGVEPPDLSVFYRVYSRRIPLEALAELLLDVPAVEAAYIKPGAEPAIWFSNIEADLSQPAAPTGDFSQLQGYLNDAAHGGVDARFAWTLAGGAGAGVRIIDIEAAWNFTHEDLKEKQGGLVGGAVIDDLLLRNHGTAVFGVVSADDNGLGVKGICFDAGVRAVSVSGPARGWGSAAAIRQATDLLSPGDIIIVEQQRPGPKFGFVPLASQQGYIPIEWWPDDMAAIRDATSLGVIVVEAGGNGRENLCDPVYDINPSFPAGPFPPGWQNPFRRKAVDTKSIIVGAGATPIHGPDSPPDLCRLHFSNFGSNFDAQGWGEFVTTCGFGKLPSGPDENFWYTDNFSGTSSATPMVAGALGCVQGILKARGVAPLSPSEARQLLHTTGSPQGDDPASPASKRIGNRPDIKEMLGSLPPRVALQELL